MKLSKTTLLSALMLGSVAFIASAPAKAAVGVSVSVGAVGIAVAGDDCDDYYDTPWGYPADYCDYDVYEEPIFVDGVWYQGPIYWRNQGGIRVFWVNGRWRRNGWVGPLPRNWAWGHRGFVRWNGWSHNHRHQWNWNHHNNWHPHHGGGHGGGGHGGGGHGGGGHHGGGHGGGGGGGGHHGGGHGGDHDGGGHHGGHHDHH